MKMKSPAMCPANPDQRDSSGGWSSASRSVAPLRRTSSGRRAPMTYPTATATMNPRVNRPSTTTQKSGRP